GRQRDLGRRSAVAAGTGELDADVLCRPDGRHAAAHRSQRPDARRVPPHARLADPVIADRRLRAAIAVLALAGVAITSYLVYSRYTGTRIVCTTGGCETVQHSKYAKAAGVPVAILGLIAYMALFATALSSRVEAAAIGAAIALGGLAFA